MCIFSPAFSLIAAALKINLILKKGELTYFYKTFPSLNSSETHPKELPNLPFHNGANPRAEQMPCFHGKKKKKKEREREKKKKQNTKPGTQCYHSK